MRADPMSTEASAIETAGRDAYLAVLVESRVRLHNHWHDSLRREAAEAEHLVRQLEKHWADFTDISVAKPNQALDEIARRCARPPMYCVLMLRRCAVDACESGRIVARSGGSGPPLELKAK
jgi:hypothetical protein